MSSIETRGARHDAGARTPTWRLVLRFRLRLRWRQLLAFPSNYSWMVMRRKYDAFTTDRAYDERPSSWLGPLGWWADRRVLRYPLHVALRERLQFVTEALVAEVRARDRRPQERRVRLLSAPCGLVRDLTQAGAELRALDPGLLETLELHALDIDERGDVIPEATRRAAAADLPVSFHREDLFDPRGLTARVRDDGPFDIVNTIGLAAWLSLDEVERLACFLHRRVMRRGSTLLIDNFARHEHSDLGDDLEIFTRYHEPAEFERTLERCGLRVTARRVSTNGVCTLYIAQAV